MPREELRFLARGGGLGMTANVQLWRMKNYYVYLLSNESKMTYTGITSNLVKRVWEHKSKTKPGFSQRYNLYKLVYVERFEDVRLAIAREKEIKAWRRSKKVILIESQNPRWNDYAADRFPKKKRRGGTRESQ